MTHGFVPPPIDNPNVSEHLRQLANGIRQVFDGKINSHGTVTLTANTDTTTLNDRRIGADSVVFLSPTTDNAASEVKSANGLWVNGYTKHSATINHSNNGQTDRTFKYLVIG